MLNLDDNGPGSLRQAVLDANAHPGADVIRFAHGLHGTITLTGGQLDITDDLTIHGPGADRLAVSGNHAGRVFSISGGATVTIAGLTITDGRVVGGDGGGGILNVGSTLTVADDVLSDNQAVGVVGVVARGGAIKNQAGATLLATDSLFSHNQTVGASGTNANGGGINNFGSTLTVSHSTFIANRSLGGGNGGTGNGGAINSQQSATATVSHSTFLGNQASAATAAGQAPAAASVILRALLLR